MGDLYSALRRQLPVNTLRVLDTCAQALPVYQAMAASPDVRAHMFTFSMFVRRRIIDLASNDLPFTGEDLSLIGTTGEERGRKGMPPAVARNIVAFHTAANLREIHEAAGPADLHDGLHMLAWLGQHADTAQRTYVMGVLNGQKNHLPIVGRVGQFAELALAGDPAATIYAQNLGIATHGDHQVVVIRMLWQGTTSEQTGAVLELAWRRHRAAATWHQPGELVALLPASRESAALTLVRDVADLTGLPCAAGTAAGPLSTMAETFALARRVSRVVPARPKPDHLYTMADVFIELGVAELPEIDRWLCDLARRLATGPDLVGTLDTYYRHDLDRSRTARALRVHPRTLDYRLQRAHELTGIDPHTVNGIRVFTTAMTRSAARG